MSEPEENIRVELEKQPCEVTPNLSQYIERYIQVVCYLKPAGRFTPTKYFPAVQRTKIMLDSSNSERIVTSVEEIGIGDCLYVERTGRTHWVVGISPERVLLEDIDGKEIPWVRDTLEKAFNAHPWIRQTESSARRTELNDQ